MSGKRQENCTNFLKGHCKYEDRCMYMHPSKGWCYFETRLYEGCKKSAAECEFRHPRNDKERDMAFEFFEEQLYHRKGACVEALSDENGFTGWHYCDKDGSDCKYAHPFSEEQLDRWIATNQSKRREWCRPKVTIGHCDYGDKACSFKHPSSPTEWIEAQEHFAEKRYNAMGACYRDLRGEHCDDHDTLQCQYAHSATPEQLRRWRSDPDRPGKRKPCLNFLRDGTCDYGKRCWFKHYHTADELEKARAEFAAGNDTAEAGDQNDSSRDEAVPGPLGNDGKSEAIDAPAKEEKKGADTADKVIDTNHLRLVTRDDIIQKMPLDSDVFPQLLLNTPLVMYARNDEPVVHVPIGTERHNIFLRDAQYHEDLGMPKEDEVKTEYRAQVEAMERS